MLIYFFLGALICFVSTLPFGLINLTVAKTTIEKSHLRGFEVAAAAAFVEIIQVLIALWFGLVISKFLENNIIVRALVASTFVFIGLYIYRRKPSKSFNIDGDHQFGSEIKTGLIISAVNPQAIPFWIIALAVITDSWNLAFQGWHLTLFLLGVFTGKMVALTGFIIVSQYLKTHLDESSKRVNHFLGIVLMVIGIIQWGRIILTA